MFRFQKHVEGNIGSLVWISNNIDYSSELNRNL